MNGSSGGGGRSAGGLLASARHESGYGGTTNEVSADSAGHNNL